MAVACVVAPLASRPLASWSEDLPEGASGLRDALAGWDSAMTGLGLTVPFDTIHAAVRWLVAQPFQQ